MRRGGVDGPADVVRDAVLRGQVSSTLAIQELRRNPKKAEERIVSAVAKATAAGKTKATKKDVGGVRMQKVKASVSLATGDSIKDVLKALAAKVRETVGHDGDDVLLTDGSISVVIEVPAPEKAKPAKKAAAPKKAATDDGEPAKLPPAVKGDADDASDPDDI